MKQKESVKECRRKAEHKVVIIGIDHHNMLNLARFFYMAGIKPYGVIVPTRGNMTVKYSKCWKEIIGFQTVEEALDCLIQKFAGEDFKPVLFPTSDMAAYHIDLRLDELSRYFIVPGIGKRQGCVAEFMDKSRQKAWAEENHIPVAYGKELDLTAGNQENEARAFDRYPCIVKPLASVFGDKTDIRVCESEGELMTVLSELKKKKYEKVLIEEYLNYEYEILLTGGGVSG